MTDFGKIKKILQFPLFYNIHKLSKFYNYEKLCKISGYACSRNIADRM